MQDKKTVELLGILSEIKTDEELESFFEENPITASSISLHDYLNEIITIKNLSKSHIISNSGLNRIYAYQILQGSKQPTRDKVIALCMGIKMDLSQIQRALTIAGLGILYPKNKRDAIIMFAVNKGIGIMDTNELLYGMGADILE
jgi:DNA-binding phage protein